MSVSTLVRPGQAAPAASGAGLSIFDPVFIGVDEFGHPVHIPLTGWNVLIAGAPGAGKSTLLNLAVGHAASSPDCRLVLLDGKRVELSQWKHCADVFVGPDLPLATATLRRLQVVIDRRTAYLESWQRRDISPTDSFRPILLAIDELAYFSATIGDKKDQETFANLLRDLVARGRAMGIIVVAATQRPSSDIIPTSLRDLFAWRMAFRCTTDSSSDIILGHGWVNKGWSANTISPTNRGLGLLIAEDGVPQLVKTAYLTDADCRRIAAHAARLRTAARERNV